MCPKLRMYLRLNTNINEKMEQMLKTSKRKTHRKKLLCIYLRKELLKQCIKQNNKRKIDKRD